MPSFLPRFNGLASKNFARKCLAIREVIYATVCVSAHLSTCVDWMCYYCGMGHGPIEVNNRIQRHFTKVCDYWKTDARQFSDSSYLVLCHWPQLTFCHFPRLENVNSYCWTCLNAADATGESYTTCAIFACMWSKLQLIYNWIEVADS